jgi:hypothetical protein
MPTLETYRRQAKLLQRWHREGNYSLGERMRRLERYRSLTDRLRQRQGDVEAQHLTIPSAVKSC